MNARLIPFVFFTAFLSSSCAHHHRHIPDRSGGAAPPVDRFQPVSLTETVLAAGGKCVVTKIFEGGRLVDIKTDTPDCVVGSGDVLVGGYVLRNNTGPDGITVGDNTFTCYGPPSPSPARCVCKVDATTPRCPPR
jgi:hypothetical protein